MKAKRIVLIVVLLLVVGLVLLFYVQNAETKVNLIFKLPFGLAWTLKSAVALPMLLLIAFLAGLLVSGGILGGLLMGANKRARSLERQSSSMKDELSIGRGTGAGASKPFPDRPPAPDDDDDWT